MELDLKVSKTEAILDVNGNKATSLLWMSGLVYTDKLSLPVQLLDISIPELGIKGTCLVDTYPHIEAPAWQVILSIET